ncbi:hypothetical protein ZYGR_0AV00180 [Zygosaccharomyces rouxii]|uniref:Histone-lysine N-methyltransferase SET5 n=1 Tax=Zygosaccharomyces rouxii TaxID=4956 RepID=A0A1Q3AI31_ZYGRO|nr:hypothetical protein ZYGR_0AV00180 [Zygosaccharomyces rouxii]
MHLQIQTLSLNDNSRSLPAESIVPSSQEVCDSILLIWREEPASEDYELEELLKVVKERHGEWKLSVESLRKLLQSHSLYASDEKKLQIYSDKVRVPEMEEDKVKLPRNVKVGFISGNKQRGLFATHDLKAGDMIFEDLPLAVVPPMDKLVLMQSGKACPLCGSSVNHSQHTIIMNGLDCGECGAVWCSKNCKKNDLTHTTLRHTRSRCKQINLNGWKKYESFCKQHVFVAAYSLGIIYACMVLEKNGKNSVCPKFQVLAEVSQRIRKKSSDSTNLGGTLDVSSGAFTSEDPEPVWTEAFSLFKEAFPDFDDIDMETYLNCIGKFNINQISGQIFPVFSFINHDCEPNVRYEIDDKLRLKLYARKPIKKGEELLTTYVNPLHGVKLRRRELRVNWGFLCQCDRCNRELAKRKEKLISPTPSAHHSPANSFSDKTRRKSSMRNARPDLHELLKNGQEFDLEIPDTLEAHHRKTSVRFDNNVSVAVEE